MVEIFSYQRSYAKKENIDLPIKPVSLEEFNKSMDKNFKDTPVKFCKYMQNKKQVYSKDVIETLTKEEQNVRR